MHLTSTSHPAALRIERARAFGRYTEAVASHASEQTAENAAALEQARRELDGIDALIGTAAGLSGHAMERRGRSGLASPSLRYHPRGEGV